MGKGEKGNVEVGVQLPPRWCATVGVVLAKHTSITLRQTLAKTSSSTPNQVMGDTVSVLLPAPERMLVLRSGVAPGLVLGPVVVCDAVCVSLKLLLVLRTVLISLATRSQAQSLHSTYATVQACGWPQAPSLTFHTLPRLNFTALCMQLSQSTNFCVWSPPTSPTPSLTGFQRGVCCARDLAVAAMWQPNATVPVNQNRKPAVLKNSATPASTR